MKQLLIFTAFMLLVYGAMIAREYPAMAIALAIVAGYTFYSAGQKWKS
jgi:hypothetical protein